MPASSLPLGPALRTPPSLAAAAPLLPSGPVDYIPVVDMPVHAPKWLSLLLFYAFWYLGNMLHNQYNTLALSAVGGKHGALR